MPTGTTITITKGTTNKTHNHDNHHKQKQCQKNTTITATTATLPAESPRGKERDTVNDASRTFRTETRIPTLHHDAGSHTKYSNLYITATFPNPPPSTIF